MQRILHERAPPPEAGSNELDHGIAKRFARVLRRVIEILLQNEVHKSGLSFMPLTHTSETCLLLPLTTKQRAI